MEYRFLPARVTFEQEISGKAGATGSPSVLDSQTVVKIPVSVMHASAWMHKAVAGVDVSYDPATGMVTLRGNRAEIELAMDQIGATERNDAAAPGEDVTPFHDFVSQFKTWFTEREDSGQLSSLYNKLALLSSGVSQLVQEESFRLSLNEVRQEGWQRSLQDDVGVARNMVRDASISNVPEIDGIGASAGGQGGLLAKISALFSTVSSVVSGLIQSERATVSSSEVVMGPLNQQAVNNVPEAADDEILLEEDATSDNLLTLLLQNDRDADGDALRVEAVTVQGSANGLEFNAGAQTLTYNMADPALQALAEGEQLSMSFTYSISDGKGGAASATASVTITGRNDAASAGADGVAVAEDAVTANLWNDVLSNDSDIDSDGAFDLTGVDVTGTLGVVTFNAGTSTLTYDATGGAFQYLGAGVTATDSFKYTLLDNHGAVSEGVVTVTVTGVNDGPVAAADAVAVNEDSVTNVWVSLLANDTDVDVSDTLVIASVDTTGTVGVVTLNVGTQTLTYDASVAGFQSLAAGATVTDSFSYTISDGNGGTSVATVTFTITGVNDAPTLTAMAAGITVAENAVNLTPAVIDSAVTFSDPDAADFNGGVLSVTYSAGGGAEDQLGVRNQGVGAGQVGVSGANVTYGGVTIGTIGSNGVNGAVLTITFNAVATQAAIEAVIENLTYATVSDDPTVSRTLAISVTDGDGGTTATSNVVVTVTPQGDLFTLTAGVDNFTAAVGDDTFQGSAANLSVTDTVRGAADNDILHLTSGQAVIDTAVYTNIIGVETWRFDGNAAHTLTVQDEYFTRLGYTGTALAIITTSTVGVTLDASAVTAGYQINLASGAGNDTVTTGAGNDTVVSGDGADVIISGAGNDSINAGAGNDTIQFTTANLGAGDVVAGGAGDDVLQITQGIVALDASLYGLQEIERIELNSNALHSVTVGDAYFAAGGGVTGNLLTVAAATSGSITVDASGVTNAAYRLSITAGGGADSILGGAGNDSIIGGEGNNTINAGGGNDTVVTGSGIDRILLGDGDDLAIMEAGNLAVTDTLEGGAGMDILRSTGGVITLATNTYTNLAGVERFELNSDQAHNLTFYNAYYDTAGFSGNVITVTSTSSVGVTVSGLSINVQNGRSMVVELAGGNDSVLGAYGNDSISTGGGNDYIRGWYGADTLSGGAGADVFAYYNYLESSTSERDTITDFVSGQDKIDVTGIYGGTLVYKGSGVFTGVAGQLRWQTDGTDTYVHYDANGDYVSDLVILLQGVTSLAQSDFIGFTAAPNFILTAALDNVAGTGADDVFDTGTSQWAVGDSIAGGGGIDTLRITSAWGYTFNPATYPNIVGVEVFEIRNSVAHSFTFTDAYLSTVGFSGSTIKLDSTSSGTITVNAAAMTMGELNIITGAGNDSINTSVGNDTIRTGLGNDRIIMSTGTDSVDAGGGQDTLDLYVGQLDAGDTLTGGEGIDLLRLNSGALVFDSTGQDIGGFEIIQMNINAAHSLVFSDNYFNSGDFTGNLLSVTTNSSTAVLVDMSLVTIGSVNASIQGGNVADTIKGGAGNDTFNGFGGADTFTGGAGNDVYVYTSHTHTTTAASDVITDFVSGTDKLNFTGMGLSYIDTAAFTGGGAANQIRWTVSGADVLVQIDVDGNGTADGTIRLENIAALDYSDFIGVGGYYLLTAASDNFIGGALGDFFQGNAAHLVMADTIQGGDGNDTLRTSSGTLVLDTATHTSLSGIDTFHLYNSAAHSVSFDDGYFSRPGLTINQVTVAVSSATGVTLNGAAVTMASNALVFTGSNGADTLTGGAGNDTLNGAAGDNSLMGGDGNDFIYLNTGNEYIDAGAGNDIIYYGSPAQLVVADTVLGGDGLDTLRVGSGLLTFNTALLPSFSGIERIELSTAAAHVLTFDDAYFSSAGFDGSVVTVVSTSTTGIVVNASAVGAGHHMSISGGNGADTFVGGAGNDSFFGGNGIDSFTGGAGNDVYYFTNAAQSAVATPDVITDFVSGQDMLDFTGIATQFYWVDTAAFSNVAGQVRWQISGPDVLVQIDRDGNSTADITVRLAGVSTLNSYDVAGLGLQYTLTAGSDNFVGGAGNDLFRSINTAWTTADTLSGGAGRDMVSITAGQINVNTASYPNLSGIESIEFRTNGVQTLTIHDGLFTSPGFEGTVFTVTSPSNGSALYNNFSAAAVSAAYQVSVTGSAWSGDTIRGGAGNDTINGGGGADLIYGGAGDDFIINGYGTIFGEDGNDTITASAWMNVDGGNGNDSIMANVNLYNDTITGGVGADTIYTGGGNDLIIYTALNHSTTADADIITDFAAGLDVIRVVGLGFTNIQAGAASGSILGYSFDGTYTNVVNAAGTFLIKLQGNIALNSSHFQFIAGTFNGSAGNDSIMGTSQNDTINGLDGNDTLYSGGGSDLINGGNGNDYIVAMAWSGTYNGDDGNDTIAGGRIMNGGLGDDSIIGSNNTDMITGGAGADIIETRGVITTRDGNSGADLIVYTALSDSATATPDIIMDYAAGSDLIVLTGLGFTDIQAGAAAGTVLGYSFDGTYTNVVNSAGTFMIRFLGNHALTSGSFQFVASRIDGSAADENIMGSWNGESIYGGDGNDTIHPGWGGGIVEGGAGNDSIWGGYGTLRGNDGNDTIAPHNESRMEGGAGNDLLLGDIYNSWDTLVGGAGADTLTGVGGWDVFIFTDITDSTPAETDILTDYAVGERIDLTGLGFTSIQAGAASGSILGFVYDGTHTVVSNAAGTFQFKVQGNITLRAEHFTFIAGQINGTAAADMLIGSSSTETILGGNGNDSIYGRGGNDSIIAGDGNDYILTNVGLSSTVWGGNGNDTIDTYGTAYGEAGNDYISSAYYGIYADGGVDNDTLIGGNNGNDTLLGGDGNDSLSGQNGNDTLNGGAGVDTLTGGGNNDIFVFSSLTDSTNVARDTITDFQNGADRFDVRGLGFTALLDFETVMFNGTHTIIQDTQTNFSFAITGNVVAQLDNSDFIFI